MKGLPEYPKALWKPDLPLKDGENPIYVNREKEEDEKLAQGWTTRCPFYEFPRMVYHEKLSARIVNDLEAQEALLGEGYSLKPIAHASDEPDEPTEIEMLRRQVAEQQRLIEELEVKKGKRGRVA